MNHKSKWVTTRVSAYGCPAEQQDGCAFRHRLAVVSDLDCPADKYWIPGQHPRRDKLAPVLGMACCCLALLFCGCSGGRWSVPSMYESPVITPKEIVPPPVTAKSVPPPGSPIGHTLVSHPYAAPYDKFTFWTNDVNGKFGVIAPVPPQPHPGFCEVMPKEKYGTNFLNIWATSGFADWQFIGRASRQKPLLDPVGARRFYEGRP